MKKFLTVLLALALVLGITGCTKKEEPRSAGKVGIVLNSFDSAMAVMKTLFEGACEDQGLEYVTLNSNGDVQTELANMESVVTQGCDVVIIMGCDGDGSAAAIDYAHSNNVPVIICGRGINADENNYYVYLAGNHEEAGKAQAEYVNNYLKENPDAVLNTCIIRGASGNTAVAGRYKGFEDNALKGEYADRINVLVDLYGEYDATKANTIASDAMTANPDLNCFITHSDEMASGIVSAIKAANKNPKDYIILSVDLSSLGQTLLENDEITGTVMMRMKSMADQAGEFCVKAIAGETQSNKKVTVEGYYQMAVRDTYKQMLADAGME